MIPRRGSKSRMAMAAKKLRIAWVFVMAATAGCGDLLPRSESVTQTPWKSYREVEQIFDKIIPHQTSIENLRELHLDPLFNPNIALLNYSDVLRRFIPGPSFDVTDLDAGVKECIEAKTACTGYEVNYAVTKRDRYGNFLADFLNFRRKVDIVGWRFNGVILIKDKVVIYKLTGGQPAIHELEERNNPLGPFQGM